MPLAKSLSVSAGLAEDRKHALAGPCSCCPSRRIRNIPCAGWCCSAASVVCAVQVLSSQAEHVLAICEATHAQLATKHAHIACKVP